MVVSVVVEGIAGMAVIVVAALVVVIVTAVAEGVVADNAVCR
jgi:hypothetical protein